MNREEQRLLQAERGTLRGLLEAIPPEDVLDRASFEARLRQVERQLAQVEADTRPPARARLTFRGRPVVGTYGVFAEFGAAATRAFTDTVSLMAASISGPLAASGRIPNREQSQLLVTRTAIGSFGFELEEYRQQPLLLEEPSAVAQALSLTQKLLEATVGTDDDLTEAAAGLDLRVLNTARSFLETLANNEAVCIIEYSDHAFSFRDVAQVKASGERLRQDNVHEEEKTFRGAFQGVLPKRRAFEFKLADEATVLPGRIGPGIADPLALNRHLDQTVTVTLTATRIGSGNPRYVLNREPAW